MRPGWVSSEPRGRRCAPGWRARAQPAPAALLRPVPTTRWCFPSAGACTTRHHRGFTCIHPSGLPRPVTPGWDEGPWAFDLRLRTPRLPATHAEAGTGPAHWPGTTPRHQSSLPGGIHSSQATSRRNGSMQQSPGVHRPSQLPRGARPAAGQSRAAGQRASRYHQGCPPPARPGRLCPVTPPGDRRPQAPQQHRPAPCRTRRRCLADPGLGGPDAGGLGAGAAA